jgi:signal transduction histidine kinase
MGGTLGTDEALPRLARIVAEGTGARQADVWLVMDDLARHAASWPGGPEQRSIPLVDGRVVPGAATRIVDVRHRGRLLGAIAITLPAGRSLSPTDDRLLNDLGAQAGLVLHNVRLVEQLRASRQRLVLAQDEERQRIERDIHDGVQQRLVTLALSLKMAASRVQERSGEALTADIEHAAREASAALTELRHLARGIHPAVVTEGGLGAAVETLAERSPFAVEVRACPESRLPAPVEITAYYIVAESLTNAAKHARASLATVNLDQRDGQLVVEVADDGVGGATARPNSGLSGLVDRVAAIGGTLEIVSPPGGGTRLRAEIPCA